MVSNIDELQPGTTLAEGIEGEWLDDTADIIDGTADRVGVIVWPISELRSLMRHFEPFLDSVNRVKIEDEAALISHMNQVALLLKNDLVPKDSAEWRFLKSIPRRLLSVLLCIRSDSLWLAATEAMLSCADWGKSCELRTKEDKLWRLEEILRNLGVRSISRLSIESELGGGYRATGCVYNMLPFSIGGTRPSLLGEDTTLLAQGVKILLDSNLWSVENIQPSNQDILGLWASCSVIFKPKEKTLDRVELYLAIGDYIIDRFFFDVNEIDSPE